MNMTTNNFSEEITQILDADRWQAAKEQSVAAEPVADSNSYPSLFANTVLAVVRQENSLLQKCHKIKKLVNRFSFLFFSFLISEHIKNCLIELFSSSFLLDSTVSNINNWRGKATTTNKQMKTRQR